MQTVKKRAKRAKRCAPKRFRARLSGRASRWSRTCFVYDVSFIWLVFLFFSRAFERQNSDAFLSLSLEDKYIKIILNGGAPVLEKQNKESDSIKKNVDLEKTNVDSLFRVKVEKKTNGDYISKLSNSVTHFVPPIVGVFTENYLPIKNHFGVYIVSKKGAFIHSVADGVIVLNNWTKETGFVVAVQHSNGFLSFYKHNSSVLKEVGSFVSKGEEIAIIGNSGELSSGPHLHFEMRVDHVLRNPKKYLPY